MCGFSLLCSPRCPPSADEDLLDIVGRRGPDDIHIIHRDVLLTDRSRPSTFETLFYFTLVASVLSLRGEVVSQPLIDKASGSLLSWNGEAWRVSGQLVTGNDSEVVFRALLLSCSKIVKGAIPGMPDDELLAQAIKEVLHTVQGPFSFLFYEGVTQRIFYGRDVLGRRSLLISDNVGTGFRLSSVSTGPCSGVWREVETGGIFMLSVSQRHEQNSCSDGAERGLIFASKSFPWSSTQVSARKGCIVCFQSLIQFQYKLPPLNRDLAHGEPRGYLPSNETVLDLKSLLQQALKVRLMPGPSTSTEAQEETPVAILFSGGIDCTILALLADGVVPQNCSIDLLNVAFENPRVIAAATKRMSQEGLDDSPVPGYASCPDRITGLSSYKQLKELRPGRRWRFVFIDVPFDQTETHRKRVCDLMYPHNTQMDLSISLALYFAARGSGEVVEAGQKRRYTTKASALISGLGADELFGGYARHAKAYERKQYLGLLDELDLDFGRLASRNLGRDDRVISFWGREARYPYLDEELVRWALRLPVWEKCGFAFTSSLKSEYQVNLEPGKLILRLLALTLGLKRTACEKKRAIQFGSRTARMSQSNRRGSELI